MIKFWKESEKGDWVRPLLVCLFAVCRLGSSTAYLSSSRSVRDRRGGSEEREKREREDDDGGDGDENDEDEDGASVLRT